MNGMLVTAALVVLVVAVGWAVRTVFRGGAPTGESSARADMFAAGTGYGADDADTLRGGRPPDDRS